MATDKSRTYAFVQLIENLPEDWEQKFTDMVMPSCYIVHDEDEAEPHVHFMVDFNSPVRATSVLPQLPDDFNIQHVEPVRNRTAYQRYMLHIGQAEKFEYPFDRLKSLFGCKVHLDEVYNVTFTDIYQLIEDNDLLSFSALLSICVEQHPELVRYIVNHTAVVRTYITDRSRVALGRAS